MTVPSPFKFGFNVQSQSLEKKISWFPPSPPSPQSSWPVEISGRRLVGRSHPNDGSDRVDSGQWHQCCMSGAEEEDGEVMNSSGIMIITSITKYTGQYGSGQLFMGDATCLSSLNGSPCIYNM